MPWGCGPTRAGGVEVRGLPREEGGPLCGLQAPDVGGGVPECGQYLVGMLDPAILVDECRHAAVDEGSGDGEDVRGQEVPADDAAAHGAGRMVGRRGRGGGHVRGSRPSSYRGGPWTWYARAGADDDGVGPPGEP